MKRFGYIKTNDNMPDCIEGVCAFDTYERALKHFSDNVRRNGKQVMVCEVLIRAVIDPGDPVVTIPEVSR